jgi:plastocyanin
MRRLLQPAAAATTLALVAGACGSSSSPSATPSGGGSTTTSAIHTSPASGGAKPPAATAELTIMAMPDGSLMFTRRHYTVAAGTVRITFRNSSGESHNLYVQQGTAGKVLGGTPTITSGSETLTLHLARGTYTYYCDVPGHREGGMQGTLTVT